jgi:hypothetical protein
MKTTHRFILAGCIFLSPVPLGFIDSSAQSNANPEPPGWYAGDAHVHLDCGVGSGHDPVTPQDILAAMKTHNLAVVSLLADMGNGEARDAVRDLPQVNGQDSQGSSLGRLLHWDAEWHFDPKGVTFEQKVLGGHLIILGLKQAKTTYAEYTYPIIQWAKQQNAIVGFAHMQYLPEGIPEELSCCLPLEYPVETALGTSDFLMEDVWRNEAAMHAYYRLLNCGFRPGLAAGTDFPCNDRKPIGGLLTFVSIPGGRFTYRNWIEGIAQGRTVISTNGHDEFLDLRVNGNAGPGEEIRLNKGGQTSVTVRWTASKPFGGRIELVRNGKVVATKQGTASPTAPVELRTSVEFKDSGWLCARRMNEQGHQTHTAAVFVTVQQTPVRASVEDAAFFVRFIDGLIQKTSVGGPWNQYFAKDLAAAQGRYRQAREVFQRIAREAQRQSKR